MLKWQTAFLSLWVSIIILNIYLLHVTILEAIGIIVANYFYTGLLIFIISQVPDAIYNWLPALIKSYKEE